MNGDALRNFQNENALTKLFLSYVHKIFKH